jgi:hypothetical protein
MVVGLTLTFTVGAVNVTEALAVLEGSAVDRAVTEALAGEGTTAGAVYSPLALMKPTVASPPGIPLTLQLTVGSEAFWTAAANRLCSPGAKDAVVGERLKDTGARRSTVAVALLVTSAVETAVTVTAGGVGSADGAR